MGQTVPGAQVKILRGPGAQVKISGTNGHIP